MTEENDVLGKHAERRRAFLARTATTSPVVGLLLAQSARPAHAATYGGGGGTTTIFETTPTFSDTTDFTFTLPETTTGFPQTTVGHRPNLDYLCTDDDRHRSHHYDRCAHHDLHRYNRHDHLPLSCQS